MNFLEIYFNPSLFKFFNPMCFQFCSILCFLHFFKLNFRFSKNLLKFSVIISIQFKLYFVLLFNFYFLINLIYPFIQSIYFNNFIEDYHNPYLFRIFIFQLREILILKILN